MSTSTLLSAIRDAAILTDVHGIVLEWNESACSMFGWRADELVGRPLSDRYPAEVRDAAQAERRRRSPGDDWDGNILDYHRDGHRLWIETHVHPVHDTAGEVIGRLEIARPAVSDQASAVREGTEGGYAASILDSMAAHVAVLGPDGRIREVNRAWACFARDNAPPGSEPTNTGLGVDYVALCRSSTGERSDEAVPAADGIEAVLHGQQSSFVLEYPCDAPTARRWFSMHVTPLSSTGGGVVVAHHDITARKEAELALTRHSRRTELALHAAHMGIWTLDLASGTVEWSPDVFAIVGVPTFDGTLAAWERLVHPDDRPVMQAHFGALTEQSLPLHAEFRIVRPSGDIRWLANVAEVECDASGAAVAIIGTVQDVTQRKHSEWALKAYNRILELIAAGAPLSTVLEAIVHLVEDQLPGSLCSVLLMDPAAGRLRSGAGGSLPAAYTKAIDGVPVGPSSGSCGTAAHDRRTVTVTDIATDPLWDAYRDLALRHGLRSCVSVPVFSSGNVPGHPKGEVIGTFALYNRAAGDFDHLTYAVLLGAEELVRRAVLAERSEFDGGAGRQDSARVIEATHLAGVAIEREQAGQALRESEQRFRSVIDSAPSAIYIAQLDGRYVFVNRAMSDLFGVPPDAWIGRMSADVLPPPLAAMIDAWNAEAHATTTGTDRRRTCPLPSGRLATVLTTHVLLRRDTGEPYAMCGLLRDISDLVDAQQEVERLWLHAPDPLFVASFDGVLQQVNPAWTRLLGWSASELTGRPHADGVHPDDRQALAEAERRLALGETVRGLELRYRARDASHRRLSWDLIPVIAERIVYGMSRDVTEERRLAEQFQHAQKLEAIGQLASGVAHDFNNLLTVINGYSQLLLDETPATDDRRESMAEVLAAGQRASDLTAQLLAFSRKAIIEPKVVDVNHVVETSTRMLRRLIGEQVHLEKRLGRVPAIRIDPGQLAQVFINLAVNARDAMPGGGQLTIETEGVPAPATGLSAADPGAARLAFARIRIADTGTGMTPEVQARIFEPFFSTKEAGKGTGLGLATIYGIVQQAGGRIDVASAPGAGTTFELTFPAVPDAPEESDEDGEFPIPHGDETILLVEDDESVRVVAVSMLARHGYRVLAARSGTEALQLLGSHAGTIDLLLTDVVMPGIGGTALAEQARALRPTLRVLFMSGHTDDAVLRARVGASTEHLLQKPFTMHALIQRVRDAMAVGSDHEA